MLNHAILWAYASVWKAPLTGPGLIIESFDALRFEPEQVICERGAFDQVMHKARAGASPNTWRHVQAAGWC